MVDRPETVLRPPPIIDDQVRGFCSTLSAEEPIYIPVKPAWSAIQSHCFDNVREGIRKSGGSIVYGWAIWLWPGVYLEAEHHGIWKSAGGKLVDITPTIGLTEHVLFAPGAKAVYDPAAFRSNLFRAIEGNPLAAQLTAVPTELTSIRDSYRGLGVTSFEPSFLDGLRVNLRAVQARMVMDNLLQKFPLVEES